MPFLAQDTERSPTHGWLTLQFADETVGSDTTAAEHFTTVPVGDHLDDLKTFRFSVKTYTSCREVDSDVLDAAAHRIRRCKFRNRRELWFRDKAPF